MLLWCNIKLNVLVSATLHVIQRQTLNKRPQIDVGLVGRGNVEGKEVEKKTHFTRTIVTLA